MKKCKDTKQDAMSLDTPRAVVNERERIYLRDQRRAERAARIAAKAKKTQSTHAAPRGA